MASQLLSRRHFAAGAGLALVGAGIATRRGGGDPAATAGDPALEQGYARLSADLATSWFSGAGEPATGGQPGIRPTNGSGDANTGTVRGVARPRDGAMWQAAQYLRFLGNDRLLDPHGASPARLAAEWRLLRATWSPAELAGDGSDGTVNASDDAAWKLQALQSLHEATDDPAILAALRGALPAVLSRYRDTLGGAGVVATGPLPFSRYGILYALPGQDPNGQGRSTTYEAGLMIASLYLHRHGAGAAFLAYPQAVYAAFRAHLRHSSGVYYQSLQLDPEHRHDGTPYLQPIEVYRGLPKQGFTGMTVGGTSAMAVLAARLYRATGDRGYLRDAAASVAGMAALERQNGCVLNDRDPWTDGFYFPDLAREVLPLPGVDPDGRLRDAILATGRCVVASRVRLAGGGFGYTADWSGNVAPTVEGRYASWTEAAAAAARDNRGGAAGPAQIMTQANSGMMVQAALVLARGAALSPLRRAA